ncbi:MAG: response regulator [Phycisphaerae bacterium]
MDTQSPHTSPLAGKRVLVVDDSRPLAALIQEILTACGANVQTAHSGTHAVSRVSFDDYDLLLLDLVMPDLSGWKVLEFIAATQPELIGKTILLTGDRHNPGTCTAIRDQHLPVIYKPFDLDKLRKAAESRVARTLTDAGVA